MGRLLNEEEIFNYYIVDKHSIKECQEHFQVCKDTFLKVLRYYNIAKSCKDGIRDEKIIFKKQIPWEISKDQLYSLYIEQNLSEEEIA